MRRRRPAATQRADTGQPARRPRRDPPRPTRPRPSAVTTTTTVSQPLNVVVERSDPRTLAVSRPGAAVERVGVPAVRRERGRSGVVAGPAVRTRPPWPALSRRSSAGPPPIRAPAPPSLPWSSSWALAALAGRCRLPEPPQATSSAFPARRRSPPAPPKTMSLPLSPCTTSSPRARPARGRCPRARSRSRSRR